MPLVTDWPSMAQNILQASQANRQMNQASDRAFQDGLLQTQQLEQSLLNMAMTDSFNRDALAQDDSHFRMNYGLNRDIHTETARRNEADEGLRNTKNNILQQNAHTSRGQLNLARDAFEFDRNTQKMEMLDETAKEISGILQHLAVSESSNQIRNNLFGEGSVNPANEHAGEFNLLRSHIERHNALAQRIGFTPITEDNFNMFITTPAQNDAFANQPSVLSGADGQLSNMFERPFDTTVTGSGVHEVTSGARFGRIRRLGQNVVGWFRNDVGARQIESASERTSETMRNMQSGTLDSSSLNNAIEQNEKEYRAAFDRMISTADVSGIRRFLNSSETNQRRIKERGADIANEMESAVEGMSYMLAGSMAREMGVDISEILNDTIILANIREDARQRVIPPDVQRSQNLARQIEQLQINTRDMVQQGQVPYAALDAILSNYSIEHSNVHNLQSWESELDRNRITFLDPDNANRVRAMINNMLQVTAPRQQ